MIKERHLHSAYYCQGQVMSISSSKRYGADCQSTCESYDVLAKKAIELENKFPIPHLHDAAVAELDGTAFVMGGSYDDAATGRQVASDRIFCLDNQSHPQGQAGTWIEQEARLITARSCAAAVAFQGKLWVAAGVDSQLRYLSSVEVFNPIVGTWHAAGELKESMGDSIALFVIKGDLFAARGARHRGMWVEKLDQQTGTWLVVGELDDGDRACCAFAACDSTIYFFGGGEVVFDTTWNSFNTSTREWASKGKRYSKHSKRQLPEAYSFGGGQAVCITPSEQLSGLTTWTNSHWRRVVLL